MTMECVDAFFGLEAEKDLDRRMWDGLPFLDSVRVYVEKLLSCPTSHFIQYICSNTISGDLPKTAYTPFSNIHLATRKIPQILLGRTDGIGYVDLGKMLQDDGVVRDIGTDRKYGEQQGKLAVELGLARRIGTLIYPSALGVYSVEMNEEGFDHLLERLVLRSLLIRLVIQECEVRKVVELRKLCGLSESMYSKVRAKFKNLRNVLLSSNETNYEWFDQKVIC